MPESPSSAPRRFVPLLERRYTLELRQQLGWPQQVLVLALAVFAGLFISGAILVAAGVSPADLLNEFIVQTFTDPENLRAVLFQAAPMVMVGLAAALAFRARFWNLGLEGQMIWGAIGATFVSIHEIGPPALRMWLMAGAALACGLAWSVFPLALKMRLGINEIISSLMLNYVAANFLLHLVYGAWKDPKDSFPYSPKFQPFERLPEIFDGFSSAIVLAAVVALLAWWFVDRSRAGLYLRFIHASQRVADAVGVPVRRLVMASVLLSGALAGLAGFMVAAGQEGRLTQAFYNGYGFSGILIAFLARNNPLAASVVAVVVATLFVAGRSLQVFYQIPFSMVQLIQAILVVCVASSDFFIRHRIRAVGAVH
ncbi:ABC transporter permease [Xylophilus rhododendri]|uniref:ABC transporter permease n=1 Tax=Xylophilus rhododendri TaxID=2697032 RepID=A0A857J851_9BURK|nr:ABC transporter permease [Xylophilus rhododendri]QHI99251.1 ABC transporter permease [Xylophilus rhododendri]